MKFNKNMCSIKEKIRVYTNIFFFYYQNGGRNK